MKLRRNFRTSMTVIALVIVFALLFIFFNAKLSGSVPLEMKTKSEIQSLNQVQVIGNRLGDKAPDFTAVTTEAKAVSLRDFAEQGKPVVVYFMATWCPWCAKDYAALSKVYKNYEDDITLISISLDLSEDFLELREYKKRYPELQKTIFAQGQEKILADYSVTKTTTKYAIGRNGTVVYRTIGAFDEEQWKTLLDAILDNEN